MLLLLHFKRRALEDGNPKPMPLLPALHRNCRLVCHVMGATANEDRIEPSFATDRSSDRPPRRRTTADRQVALLHPHRRRLLSPALSMAVARGRASVYFRQAWTAAWGAGPNAGCALLWPNPRRRKSCRCPVSREMGLSAHCCRLGGGTSFVRCPFWPSPPPSGLPAASAVCSRPLRGGRGNAALRGDAGAASLPSPARSGGAERWRGVKRTVCGVKSLAVCWTYGSFIARC